MFGWLLKNRRVTAMARTIHEMCCYAHHLRDTLDAPLHRYFTRHPMLKGHRAPAPADPDQVHIFSISDGRHSFEVMVHDGQQNSRAWLAVSPGEDFYGATVQSGRKGRYIVRIDPPISRPLGHLATKLVDEFVTTYDAANTSI